MTNYTPILSIAGSDSGGCAGIQADIKSISACGGYAASVITATTAQNTQGVLDIHPIPLEHLALQLDAVLQDIQFNAIKIGMLHSAEVIDCVQSKLAQYSTSSLVLDPVMVATSGDRLINQDAIRRLSSFIPDTRVITPNLPEAEVLLGCKIYPGSQKHAAQQLGVRYNTSVLLKGGHTDSAEITDVLYCAEKKQTFSFSHPYVETVNTHGTGCSLSSALATHLGLGLDLFEATEKSCNYIYHAIKHGRLKQLGTGNGPIDHFYQQQINL